MIDFAGLQQQYNQIESEIQEVVLRVLKGGWYILGQELDVLELESRIQTQVQQGVDKSQREYYLSEQMRAIQTELVEEDDSKREIIELRARLVVVGDRNSHFQGTLNAPVVTSLKLPYPERFSTTGLRSPPEAESPHCSN